MQLMIDSTNDKEGLGENEHFNFLIYPSMFKFGIGS